MKKKLAFGAVVRWCVAAALFLALVIWILWGNKALMASEAVISGGRTPRAFSGFLIAHVSDLHNAELGKNNVEILCMLSENNPDIITITGDLVDSQHTDMDVALDFVRRAVSIAPVYYVTGNHEAWLSQYEKLRDGLEEAGAVVLEDRAVFLERGNEKIMLIGLSDPDFTIQGDMFGEVPAMIGTRLKSLMDEEKSYTILLSHRPELFETYVNCGVDLVLSGHAHGGQFRLPFVGGLIAPDQGLFPKYDSGLYTEDGTSMVVSRGIGNSVIPFRINNRPEIVFVELR